MSMKLGRRRLGSKPLDLSPIREALADGKVHSGVGIVYVPNGESQHYEIFDGEDVLVWVKLMPLEQPLFCRLGGFAGGASVGMWRIPPEGTEVAVMIPDGDFDFDPMIVATLATGATVENLNGDDLFIVNTKKVKLKSLEDDMELDADGQVLIQAADGGEEPVARKTDPVDMGTWVHVPASGTGVTPCQLIWTPPGSVTPQTISVGSALSGEISDGSTKAKCG